MTSRLDVALVDRGLARSRHQAHDLIRRGLVQVGGRPSVKPSTLVDADSHIQVAHAAAWVSRSAAKLDHALQIWPIRVTGLSCADVGACTGGFTQVLLAAGAAQVYAIDVGHGQLAPELADDPRVHDLSGHHVKSTTARDVGGGVGLIVCDLSFVATSFVMRDLAGLAAPECELVALIKPQFEVGKERLPRSGVVRDDRDQAEAIVHVATAATAAGWGVMALAGSPIRGGSGNREYLLWGTHRAADALTGEDLRRCAIDLVKEGPS